MEETGHVVNDANLAPAQVSSGNGAVCAERAKQSELFDPKSIVEPLQRQIDTIFGERKLLPDERAILGLLVESWGRDPISQRNIARSQPWLGCHPTHEADVARNQFETTTRRVRWVIRRLRVNHNIPVLSTRDGYFLPRTDKQCREYLIRTERESRARAKSSIETYQSMRNAIGMESEYFERLSTL